jgi:hypothetical protein
VRAPDAAPACELEHVVESDVVPGLSQGSDHLHGAFEPVVAQFEEAFGQRAGGVVDEVAEDVTVGAVEPGGELDPGDDGDGQALTGFDSRPDALDGVVIGDRQHVEPGGGRQFDETRGRERAVRSRAVDVEVRLHGGLSSALGRAARLDEDADGGALLAVDGDVGERRHAHEVES